MADGVWKAVKELKNRLDGLEEAYNETIDRYDGNFKMLEGRSETLKTVVNHNADVISQDEKNFWEQINSLKETVNSLRPDAYNAKFAKVWVAVGFGSLAIFVLCRKLQKIEDRIDAIEEEKDKR